jgi:DNA modification methylase
LVAAQKTGRLARVIECDPLYCDTIIRRFAEVTGQAAVHGASRKSFAEYSVGLAGAA